MEIHFKKIRNNAVIPTRARKWDAGYDLYAAESLIIAPMERKVVPIGIQIEIPAGYYGRIAPRSGIAVKDGIDVMAGVIDSGYRDEIGVVLVNLNLPQVLFTNKNDKRAITTSSMFGDKNRFDIVEGDRIAQIIIEKCHYITWKEQEDLSETDRGGGFGSTGI